MSKKDTTIVIMSVVIPSFGEALERAGFERTGDVAPMYYKRGKEVVRIMFMARQDGRGYEGPPNMVIEGQPEALREILRTHEGNVQRALAQISGGEDE